MSPGRSRNATAESVEVWAVVVTFDRVERLRTCLEALAAQSRPPERVLVVDNGSGEETRAFLERARSAQGALGERLEILRLEENLGPAGGFAAGLERAARGEATHAWAFDDDVVPDRRCLELLVAAAGREPELLYPAMFDASGRPEDYPAWHGVLIPTEAIRQAGPPDARLFWWIEDTEYLQWRLPRVQGLAVRRVPEARIEHHGSPRDTKPAWKLYYEVRNTLHYRLRVQRGRPFRRLHRAVRVLTRALLRTLFVEHHKGRKLRLLVRGTADGLAGRLGKTVDPADG